MNNPSIINGTICFVKEDKSIRVKMNDQMLSYGGSSTSTNTKTNIENLASNVTKGLDGIKIVNNESDVVTTGGNFLWFVLAQKKIVLTFEGAKVFDAKGGYYG